MRYAATLLLAGLLMTGCAEVSQTVQDAQQAVDAGKQAIEVGKQAVELGKQVVDTGKQIASSEVAQQLQTYLQQKYESSEALRNAMFSGDGKLIVSELLKTELATFSFYQSDLLGIELKGKLTGDGKLQVLSYDLNNPSAQPTVIHEFVITIDQNGQIQVQ